jgi:uncharacterized protein (TIGR03792 family)
MSHRSAGRLPSLLLSLWLLLLVLVAGPTAAFALGHGESAHGLISPEATVVEYLRLKVPADNRQAWLQAERDTWEPWLQRQDGFLGRQLLWDAECQEGILLIHWRSRRQWLAIPEREIGAVQHRFELAARRALGWAPEAAAGSEAGDPEADVAGVNPFPLVFSGALEALGVTPPSAAEEAP